MTIDYYNRIKDTLPATSGVYVFRDRRKKPLYIGKAKNLSSRVRSYFSTPRTSMIGKMVEAAFSISWQETLSEIEALILESSLIKKHKTKYNSLMRDDKQYFYVGITKEQFPRLFITHQPRTTTFGALRDSPSKLPKNKVPLPADYIGPFTDGRALKTTLRLLRKIFPFCTCKQKHLNYCLNFHIGNCLGFCCLKQDSKILSVLPKRGSAKIDFLKKVNDRVGSDNNSRLYGTTQNQTEEYGENIRSIKKILSGKKKDVLKDLISQLKNQNSSSEFSDSATISEKISQVQKFFLNTKVIQRISTSNKLLSELGKVLVLNYSPVRIEGYDISNIQGLFATGAMVVFINGAPDKNEYRKFKIRSFSSPSLPEQPGDTGMLREVMERRLRHKEWQYPDLILVDGGIGQVGAVSAVLKEFGLKIPVVGLVKNERHIGERLILGTGIKSSISLETIPIAVKNLLLHIDSEAHRFAIQYYRKRHSFKL